MIWIQIPLVKTEWNLSRRTTEECPRIPTQPSRKSLFLFTAQENQRSKSGPDFQRVQIWNYRSQKPKTNYGSHPVSLSLCKNLVPETDRLRAGAYVRISNELSSLGVSPRYVAEHMNYFENDVKVINHLWVLGVILGLPHLTLLANLSPGCGFVGKRLLCCNGILFPFLVTY